MCGRSGALYGVNMNIFIFLYCCKIDSYAYLHHVEMILRLDRSLSEFLELLELRKNAVE